MPKMPGGFDAGNLGLRPTETGVEATAGAARRLGAFYNQAAGATDMLARETDRLGAMTARLGSETAQLGAEKGAALAGAGRAIGGGIAAAGDAAVKYLDHQQISHGSATWATFLQNETNTWNDAVKKADPNDPGVAQRYLEGLNDRLVSFKQEGFYTENAQKWAEAHTEALRQHMAEKTMSDMSTLAGEAVVVNHRQTVNALSATVHGDPSSLDFALAGLKSSAEGLIASSPNLRGTDVARVRTQVQQAGAEAIVKSAAIGYIEKTGKMPEWVTDPKYAPYVNGAELKMLEKQAQVQQKADLIATKQLETYQRQQQERAASDAMTKSMTDNFKADENGRLTINPRAVKDALDIARQYPEAGAAPARAMIDFIQAQQNKDLKAIDAPDTVKGLTDRMFDPNNPTTVIDLMRARAKGELSDHTFTMMHGMVKEMEESPLKGPIYQDAMTAAKERLGTGVMMDGHQRYLSFVQTFLPEYLRQQRAGTLPADALDMKNPNSLISKSLQSFQPTPQELLKAHMLKNLQGAATGDLPGFGSPEPRKVGDVPVPAALGGVAALQYNPTKKQWRDQASGTVYDSAGQPVAR